MIRDAITSLAAGAVVFVFLCSLAFANDAKPPLNCEAIRIAVAEHGKVKAVRWAREQGYSWKEIAEARRCLK